ncbi:MAG TPA: phosphatase PAP2 family protein [Solirubrobacteraceae bacterium]|nr:phosphatase PAP2 family protein [Solirubrobacteraceae bacterium]
MPIRPRIALLGAGACLVLLALVWFAVAHVGFFRHADESGFLQFYDLHDHGIVVWLARHFVRGFDPNPYVYLVLLPLVVALLRGRPRVVLAIGAIVLGANATTELLKHVLVSPRPGEWVPGSAISSWPSGHSTAAMSLALASVLAVPARLRPAAAALGASLAIAVGYSVLATAIHYPSDVFGGFLVAGTWTLTVVGGLLAAERRWPVNRSSSSPPVSLRAVLGAPGAVIFGAAVVGLGIAVSRPHDVISYARLHQAFVLEAAGIAALSLAVSTAVLLSVRR